MRLLFGGFTLAFLTAVIAAQTPPKAAGAKPASPQPARRPAGTLAQVMRGIYFPNANLIFDVQQSDPGAPKTKNEGTGSATATYSNAYAGWELVENAAVALTDGVDLILQPGRTCQNGKPVPVNQPDFQKFARDMREAGRVALQAARTRNQEKVSDATNNITDACSNCHEVYRDTGPADSPARCTPPAKK
jgi:cytochrome c553